jgi:hypothetical protein
MKIRKDLGVILRAGAGSEVVIILAVNNDFKFQYDST